MLAATVMLGGMKDTATTYQEAKEAVARLRTDVDSKFQPEMSKLADLFDGLLDGAAKGGRARAKKLTKKRRSEIARKAANARWHKG